MLKLSEYAFLAALMSVALALLCHVIVIGSVRVVRAGTAMAGGPSSGTVSVRGGARKSGGIGSYGTLTAWLALGFLTASLVFRTIATGHGPFANMYEFSVAFAWGALAAYAYFDRRYGQRILGAIVLVVALTLLLYATTIPATIDPLVPALQNSLLLTVHVAVAIIAYGAFSVAFAAAALHLVQPKGGRRGLPKPDLLDEIAHRAVVVGYPFLTLTVVLGAIWAEIAWGKYWSWDPKETASLVTWLVYGAYLHARVVHGWRGRKAAWLLIIGFAATMFTFYGNLFFGGLHAYAAIGM
jgi:cytochrome c-type biogenesis protein CcsB